MKILIGTSGAIRKLESSRLVVQNYWFVIYLMIWYPVQYGNWKVHELCKEITCWRLRVLNLCRFFLLGK
jgi:hypothetical protein